MPAGRDVYKNKVSSMNKYTFWKYFPVIVLTVMGLFFVLPAHSFEPTLYITLQGDQKLKGKESKEIQKTLKDAQIAVKSIDLEQKKLSVSFNNIDDQFNAIDPIQATLGENYFIRLPPLSTSQGWSASLKSFFSKPHNDAQFLLGVDIKKALDTVLKRYKNELINLLRSEKLSYLNVTHRDDAYFVAFKNKQLRANALKVLQNNYNTQLIFEEKSIKKSIVLKISLTNITANKTKRLALQQNMNILSRRLYELGVSTPMIQQQGWNQIVVELPKIKDMKTVREILAANTMIEFRMVDEDSDPYQAHASKNIPTGDILLLERNGNPILLKQEVMLTGEHIHNSSTGLDYNQDPAIMISLDEKGAAIFSRETSKNIGKLLAVVLIEYKVDMTKKLDKSIHRKTTQIQTVINIARILEELGKRFQISGLDSTQQANNLALLLRAGVLAAPIYIIDSSIKKNK